MTVKAAILTQFDRLLHVGVPVTVNVVIVTHLTFYSVTAKVTIIAKPFN